MEPVDGRSQAGQWQWCESNDKHRAQWLEWHPNTTQLRQSCGYRDGKPEGSFTAWHPNGRPWVQGQFLGGLKMGKWKQWDRSGNAVAEGDYTAGRLVAGAPVAGMAGCDKALKK
jgi:antitoxin component YwqK of YwqJK toxin-antitoxin module